MRRAPVKQRSSKRTGRVSSVDKGRSIEDEGHESEPSQSSPLPNGRAPRAAKLAVLQDPPWAALKPRSKQTRTVPDTVNCSNSADTSKRKRSRSNVEVQQPKSKKPKPALAIPTPSPTRKPDRVVRRARHRALSIDVDEPDDCGYNEDGEDGEEVDTSKYSEIRDELEGVSSAEEECGEVPPNVLKAEEGKVVRKQTMAKPTRISWRSISESIASNPRSSSPAMEFATRVPKWIRSESMGVSSRPSTPASEFSPAGPPTSDPEDGLDDIQVESDSNVSSVPARKKTRQELKLEQERPIIRARTTLNTVQIKKETPTARQNVVAVTTGEDSSAIPWKPRTNLKLYMKSKKTSAIGLKDQNLDISKVIRASYEVGTLDLVVGDEEAMLKMSNDALLRMSTPFRTRGLEDIALRALIKAADSNGYDGEYDIAHRIEADTVAFYSEPLQDYVAHRLSLYRSNFKKSIALIAPGILGLQTNSSQRNMDLLTNNSFIYPWSSEKGFDTSKPFQSLVIAKAIECIFFTPGSQYNSLGLEFSGQLASSSDAKSTQREVSVFMVALASVAIASVIQDTILARSTDFAGPQLDSLFKRLVIILFTLRRSKPITYHKTMHNMYSAAVGDKATGFISADLTADSFLREIDWDLIDE